MITIFFLNLLITIFELLFSAFPDVPNFMPEVDNYLQFLISVLEDGINLAHFIIGDAFHLYVTWAVAVILLEQIWLIAMRILSFIPVIGQGGT